MRDNTSRVRVLCRALTLVLVALLATVGCEDKSKPKVEVTAKPTQQVAPSGPLEKLAAPEGALVYGGVDKPRAFAANLSLLTMGMPAKGGELTGVLQTFARQYGLKDTSAIDDDGPMRFAILDPKAAKEPLVVIVATKDKLALTNAMPASKKANDAGNDFSYPTGPGETTYVSFIDDFAVFSKNKALLAKHKAFLVKLIGATVSNQGAVVVAVQHITKLYDAELTAAAQQASSGDASAAPRLPMGTMPGVGKLVDSATQIARDLDHVVITADASGDGAKLRLDILPKKGSSLAKTVGALGERKSTLLAKLPPSTPLALAMSIDPDKADELTRSLSAWALQLSLGQETAPKYRDAMNDYWKATTGEVLFAAHQLPGAEQLQFVALFGVRDAKAARKALTTLRSMYEEQSVAKLYEQMGVKIAFKPNAYKVGDVAVDTVTAKIEAPKGKPGDLNLERALGPTASLFANLMSSHVAIGEEMGVIAYGKDGKAAIEAWLGGKIPGGLDKSEGVARANKNAAPGTFLLMYGSPLDLIGRLQQQPAPGQAATPQAEHGLGLSAGAKSGVMHIVVDIPAGQARSLAQTLMSLSRGLR